MKKNAILFSKIDREDGWISGGMSFKVEDTSSYESAYNELKVKLESPELVAHIIDDRSLEDDLFTDYDNTDFKFKTTRFEYGLVYVFENTDGDEAEYKFSCDFIIAN